MRAASSVGVVFSLTPQSESWLRPGSRVIPADRGEPSQSKIKIKKDCRPELGAHAWFKYIWMADGEGSRLVSGSVTGAAASEEPRTEPRLARLVFQITSPLKTFTSSVSLRLQSCYWKTGKVEKHFNGCTAGISHTLTHARKYISSSISPTATSSGRHLRTQSIFQSPPSSCKPIQYLLPSLANDPQPEKWASSLTASIKREGANQGPVLVSAGINNVLVGRIGALHVAVSCVFLCQKSVVCLENSQRRKLATHCFQPHRLRFGGEPRYLAISMTDRRLHMGKIYRWCASPIKHVYCAI